MSKVDFYSAYLSITLPWYVDDTGAGFTFAGIHHHLDDLMMKGPPRGYFPELTKSVLVQFPWNIPQADAFFRGYSIHIVTARRYLGGFVGTEE